MFSNSQGLKMSETLLGPLGLGFLGAFGSGVTFESEDNTSLHFSFFVFPLGDGYTVSVGHLLSATAASAGLGLTP